MAQGGLNVRKTARFTATKILALLAALLLVCLVFPTQVFAANLVNINSISIQVELHQNGNAQITEVWDMSFPSDTSATEAYITKHNLDDQEIWDLYITDETGQEFTNVGAWDVDRSRSQKAGECGIVETNGGYELCWGFGTTGQHVYTVQYTMSNVVKGYEGADAIDQWFLSKDLASTVPSFSMEIYLPGTEFTLDNTRVWGFGHTGEIYVENGAVSLINAQTIQKSQYVAAMVAFTPGIFSPSVNRAEAIEDVRNRALEGSGYTQPPDGQDFWAELSENGDGGNFEGNTNTNTGTGGGSSSNYFTFSTVFGIIGTLISFLAPWFIIFVVAATLIRQRSNRSSGRGFMSKKQYAEVAYSRNLPFGGNMPVTYTRLKATQGITNSEGNIIGAYLLRWMRTQQVDIVKDTTGFFNNKETDAIRLYTPRDTMTALERGLYDILVAASGPDWILQSKELEKWSRRNYNKIERWLNQVENQSNQELRQMGAAQTVQTKGMFGLFSHNTTAMTPLGNQLTYEMYGFKKYLEDFTIINEREAREVQLWDEYLVFAQVFGIADKVAQQFNELYPDYFVNLAGQAGGMPLSTYDTFIILHLSRSLARSAQTGYRSGYNAAHSSSSSYSSGGGGGGFSGGGGSSSSGGGSSGGGAR